MSIYEYFRRRSIRGYIQHIYKDRVLLIVKIIYRQFFFAEFTVSSSSALISL